MVITYIILIISIIITTLGWIVSKFESIKLERKKLADENYVLNEKINLIFEKYKDPNIYYNYRFDKLNFIEEKYNILNSEIEKLQTLINSNFEEYNRFLNREIDDDFLDRISNIKADFLIYNYTILEKYLRTKKYPAPKAANDIKELKLKYKELLHSHNLLIYKYEILFTVFPELENYFETIEEIINYKNSNLSDIKQKYDYSRDFLSKEEYLNLSESERNQLALDRYIKGNKSKWQIGRDFELFCGQKFELDGWEVEYFGMTKKLEDLGRDLIIKKGKFVNIIQCKYWAEEKPIREKHISQLYGTTKVYELLLNKEEQTNKIVRPKIITHSKLSEEALRFANILGVEIVVTKMSDFPRIKCNITSTNLKIYHLPFDQQYDRTKINKKGEFYALTIKEAEENGFRRAFKFYNI